MIAPPSGFNLSGPDNSCSTDSVLNIGLGCILGIVFDPPTAGGFESSVVLTDNSLAPAGASMQPVPVAGTGVAVQSPTTTTLTASPNPAIAGQSVTLTATVSPTPTGGTLGTVSFCLNGSGPDAIRYSRRTPARTQGASRFQTTGAQESSLCGSGTVLDIVTVSANGVATLAISSLPLGADNITAAYSGNGTLATSTSSTVTVTINGASASTTTLTASPNPAIAGASVTLTATVSPTPTGQTLGSVDFCLNGAGPDTIRSSPRTSRQSQGSRRTHTAGAQQSSSCGSGTLLGTANVGAGGTATFAITSLAVGANSLTAVYSGNATLATSTSGVVTETITGSATSTTTLTASPNPATAGASVTFTATVSPTPTGETLGSVDFCLNGTGPDGIRNSPRTSIAATGRAAVEYNRRAR